MILLVFLSVVLISMYVKSRYNVERYPKPPLYPGSLPLVGHTLKLFGDNEYMFGLMKEIGEKCHQNGGVMLMKIFLDKYYVITDPEDFLTAANQCLEKHYSYSFFKPWLGDGLITSPDIATWKRHRKLLSPSFRQQVIDGFLPIFNDSSKLLVEQLRGQVGKGPFDHSHFMDAISLNSICQIAFGLPDADVEHFNLSSFMKASQEMMHIVAERLFTVYKHSDVLYNLTALKRKQDIVVGELNRMSEEVLRAKRQKINKDDHVNDSKLKAFMDLALELANEGLLSEKEVLEELNSVILAGFETTGNTLMFTLLLLGSHPEVQKNVFEEIEVVFGDSSRDVEKRDLCKLVYLEAVIKESMRLYCITPVMLRAVDKDVVLKSYTLPAGSSCLLFNFTVSRHPSWGPDAGLFRPARWLHPGHNTFTGFGVGSRLCLGKNYAMMSMKTTLVHLLRHYRISSDVTQLRLKVEPLLKPVSGHKISLEYL